MRKMFLAALISLMAFPAAAQVLPKLSFNLSSTVAATNTFQSVQASNPGRLGCVIQNNGTNSMYVYFGPIASATLTNSAKLAAGQSINCENTTGNVVLTDQVSITGTISEAFFANFQ